MNGSGNLPSGCKDSDIPGNSPEDEAYEKFVENNEDEIIDNFIEANLDEFKALIREEYYDKGTIAFGVNLQAKYEKHVQQSWEGEMERRREDKEER